MKNIELLFGWKGWQIIKWIFGFSLCWLLVFIISGLETDKNFEKSLWDNFVNKINETRLFIHSLYLISK